MIIDNLKNARLYFGIRDSIRLALEFLQKTDFSEIAPGEYPLSDGIYYISTVYEPGLEKDKQIEAHRKYIDIQYLFSGSEAVGYKAIGELEVSIPYNSENDIIFYQGEADKLKLKAGDFMILFPDDGHIPGIKCDTAPNVKKVVIKVPV